MQVENDTAWVEVYIKRCTCRRWYEWTKRTQVKGCWTLVTANIICEGGALINWMTIYRTYLFIPAVVAGRLRVWANAICHCIRKYWFWNSLCLGPWMKIRQYKKKKEPQQLNPYPTRVGLPQIVKGEYSLACGLYWFLCLWFLSPATNF